MQTTQTKKGAPTPSEQTETDSPTDGISNDGRSDRTGPDLPTLTHSASDTTALTKPAHTMHGATTVSKRGIRRPRSASVNLFFTLMAWALSTASFFQGENGPSILFIDQSSSLLINIRPCSESAIHFEILWDYMCRQTLLQLCFK